MLMVINNYWILLGWIIFGGFFLSMFGGKEYINVCGVKELRYSKMSSLLLFLPYIIWAGFRNDTIGDTWAYRTQYLEAPGKGADLLAYVLDSTKDKGFSVLMAMIKVIFGNSDLMFLLIIAIFQGLCLAVVYRKYSCDYWTSVFLFVASTDYLSWMHNGIRQFIAVAGIFACTSLILRKKYVPLIVVILLMSTIHASALIMIPIIFVAQGEAWNKRTLALIVAIVFALAFIDQFTSVLEIMTDNTQYEGIISGEIWSNDDGTNLIRVFVYSIPALLSLIGKKFIKNAHNPLISLCCNMSVISSAIYLLSSFTSGIYVGRLPIYCSLYSYILLPWLLDNMFTRKSKQIMYAIMYMAYIAFFYYQLHFAWGLL